MFWRKVQGVFAMFIVLAMFGGMFWVLSFIGAFISGSFASIFLNIDILGNAVLVANYTVAGGILFILLMYAFGVRTEVEKVPRKRRSGDDN